MVMLMEQPLKSGHNTSQGASKMIKRGSIILSIWCVINFMLAITILSYVIVLKEDSPILQVASFSEAEIASLSAKTIAALNCLTILYNSCSLVVSALTWPLVRKNLIAGQKWAFWTLVFVIGFIEVMAFFASSYIGHGRWQVNVVQSILYVVGIGLCACPILQPKADCMIKQKNKEGVLT
jgi:hypothetical protein